ncbi:hypothetical protein F4779DRAFT_617042 [Xylariaceae sp. FL0662B]|nr:hypothetical protein F4779DRAFT_617042 [Xylariaceae sp. FL0662B]
MSPTSSIIPPPEDVGDQAGSSTNSNNAAATGVSNREPLMSDSNDRPAPPEFATVTPDRYGHLDWRRMDVDTCWRLYNGAPLTAEDERHLAELDAEHSGQGSGNDIPNYYAIAGVDNFDDDPDINQWMRLWNEGQERFDDHIADLLRETDNTTSHNATSQNDNMVDFDLLLSSLDSLNRVDDHGPPEGDSNSNDRDANDQPHADGATVSPRALVVRLPDISEAFGHDMTLQNSHPEIAIGSKGSSTHQPQSPRYGKYHPYLDWTKVDFVAQVIVLREISQDYKSFQAACVLLSLEPAEVQKFLRRYHRERMQAEEWRQSLLRRDPVQGAPDKLGPILVNHGSIAYACEFLKFLGLNQYVEPVTAWSHRWTAWPLHIDDSDFDPTQLKISCFNFPVVCNDNVVVIDEESTVIAFQTADPSVTSNGLKLRIHCFRLPAGAIILGPHAAHKQISTGGRFVVRYPEGDDFTIPNAKEFLVCTNAPKTPENVQSENVHPQNVLSRNVQADNVQPGNVQPENVQPQQNETPLSILYTEGSKNHHSSGQSFFENAFVSSPTMEKMQLDNLWPIEGTLVQANQSTVSSLLQKQKPVPGHPTQTTYPANQSFTGGPDASNPPIPGPLSPQPVQRGTLEAVQHAFTGSISGSFGMEDPDQRRERQITELARHDEEVAQAARVMPKVLGPTIAPSRLRAAFHGHNAPVGPSHKAKIMELQNLARDGYRALFSFALPPGGQIVTPTGEAMSFDPDEERSESANEPNSAPVGKREVYTCIMPDDSHLIPQYRNEGLPSHNLLRMTFTEPMAIFHNGQLLPRLMEKGIHQCLFVDDRMVDIFGENGMYHLFNNMAQPPIPAVSESPGGSPYSMGYSPSHPIDLDKETPANKTSVVLKPAHKENIASPLREAKEYLRPYKEVLRREEQEEKDRETQPQRLPEQKKNRMLKQIEIDAKDNTDPSEKLGRGRRRPAKNTQYEKIGLVAYNPEELSDEDDDSSSLSELSGFSDEDDDPEEPAGKDNDPEKPADKDGDPEEPVDEDDFVEGLTNFYDMEILPGPPNAASVFIRPPRAKGTPYVPRMPRYQRQAPPSPSSDSDIEMLPGPPDGVTFSRNRARPQESSTATANGAKKQRTTPRQAPASAREPEIIDLVDEEPPTGSLSSSVSGGLPTQDTASQANPATRSRFHQLITPPEPQKSSIRRSESVADERASGSGSTRSSRPRRSEKGGN